MDLKNLKTPDALGGDKARVLMHGQAGTGKTSLAGSMAEVGKLLYTYVPGEEGINSLVGIKGQKNISLLRIEKVADFEELFLDLLAGGHGFNTVCIDSVSALHPMVGKYLLGLPHDAASPAFEGRGFGFWGDLGNWFTDFFTKWYALASRERTDPLNVVMTSQTKSRDQDGSDTDRMMPDLSKTALAAALSRPDYIFYTHMAQDEDDYDKFRHVVRVKPADNIAAKIRCTPDQYEKLPDVLGKKNRVTLPQILSTLGVKVVD